MRTRGCLHASPDYKNACARLITASLSSYTGKDKAQVENLFLQFAVFPEDVLVPVGVLDALAPMWCERDTKRPHLKVRSWCTALIRCSLAKGSMLDGVNQHDIVRHFVITRHTDDTLRAMQRNVVDALLAARPAGGYPDHAPDGSLESYVATSLWWHIRGSIGADDAVSMDLIENKDNAVKSSLALAMGKERLEKTVRSWEDKGDKLAAAKLCMIGRMLLDRGQISMGEHNELVYRAVDLITAVSSDETIEFEMEVLKCSAFLDVRNGPRERGGESPTRE